MGDGTGRDTEQATHRARHVTLVREPCSKRYLARWQITGGEQGSRAFHSALNDVLMNGHARRSLEERLEMGGADGGGSREPGDREILIEMFFDERDHAAKLQRREAAPSSR